jgi:hypothetical protein
MLLHGFRLSTLSMSIENELTSGRSEALQILSHPGKPCAKVLRPQENRAPSTKVV